MKEPRKRLYNFYECMDFVKESYGINNKNEGLFVSCLISNGIMEDNEQEIFVLEKEKINEPGMNKIISDILFKHFAENDVINFYIDWKNPYYWRK